MICEFCNQNIPQEKMENYQINRENFRFGYLLPLFGACLLISYLFFFQH